MTALPPAADFTSPTTTEGQFKAAITSLREFLAGLLGDDGEAETARLALDLVPGVTVQPYSPATARTDTAQSWAKAQRGGVVVLAGSEPIIPDFADGNFFEVTLAGNRTLATPTNLAAGQSGVIRIVQDATGGRTLSFSGAWKFPSGEAPSLTAEAGAVDLLAYYAASAGRIEAALIQDVR